MKNIILFIFVFINLVIPYYLDARENNEGQESIKRYCFENIKNNKLLLIEKSHLNMEEPCLSMHYNLFLSDSYLHDNKFFNDATNSLSAHLFYNDKVNSPYEIGLIFPPEYYIKPTELYRGFIRYKRHSYFGSQTIRQKKYKNEIFGSETLLWDSFMWDFVDTEFKTQKRNLLVSWEDGDRLYIPGIPPVKSYEKGIREGTFFLLNTSIYKKISEEKKISNYKKLPCFIEPEDLDYPPSSKMDKLLEQSSLTDSYPNAFGPGKVPILLIDAKHHSERIDKDDWKVYSFLNSKNGDFFGYFIFEEQMNMPPPFFIRKWALDHLAGIHICQKSTVGIILNPKEKVVKKNFDMKKILFALVQNKAWKPDPVPENKNTLPEDRLFYREEFGRLFGSYSKVWELGIWERLGMTFKLNPKAEIYLCGYGTLLQAAETQTVEEEHALIKKCGVRMTAERYAELEKLRKSQK